MVYQWEECGQDPKQGKKSMIKIYSAIVDDI